MTADTRVRAGARQQWANEQGEAACVEYIRINEKALRELHRALAAVRILDDPGHLGERNRLQHLGRHVELVDPSHALDQGAFGVSEPIIGGSDVAQRAQHGTELARRENFEVHARPRCSRRASFCAAKTP